MRLSVECAFPYLRKRGAVSRKSALCSGGLTEKRSVGGQPHGKAHSGRLGSRESAVCDSQIAQTALFRHIAAQEAWGATARQAAGHYQKWLNWANVFEQPPARLRGGCSRICKFSFEFDFTKSRSLGAQLGCAVWVRSLGRKPYGKAHPRLGRDTISSPMVIPVRVYEERQEV